MHRVVRQPFQTQSGEAFEIAIERRQGGAVLDRDGRQVGIGGQVSALAHARQQARQQKAVAFGRVENAGVRMIQPVVDQAQGIVKSECIGEYPGLGGNADKAEQSNPRETDACRLGESAFHPVVGQRVLRTVGVDRVQQHIDIGRLHGR